MFSFSYAGSVRVVLALALGLMATAPAKAQSVDDKFKAGADLYFRGKVDEALKAFQEILAENPSNEDALRLYGQAGKELFALMLIKGGEFESTAKRFLELATVARTEKSDDADTINGLVETALTGDFLAARDALYALSANHGEYGAAPFIAVLGDEDNQEKRVKAITCLNHMAGDAVLPLIAALQSDNERVVRNAVACLGVIGDARAVPALKAVSETTKNEVNRGAADESLMKITGKAASSLASSTELFLAQATRYLQNDSSVVAPFDTKDAVWNWSGEGVAATKVPAILRHIKLAQQCCLAAVGAESAQAALLAAYAAEKAALASTKEMGAEGEAPEANPELDVLIASGGPKGCSDALTYAIANDASTAAVELLKALESMGASTDAMRAALGCNYKSVRYAAAFALSSAGDQSADVVGALGQALGEDALRTVLVIDDRSESRNVTAAALREAGYTVITADSGALGFARSRTVPPKDAVVVRASLADVTLDQFVYDSDFRANAAALIVVSDAASAETVKSQYEGKGKVKGFVTDPIAADALVETVKAALPELNHERAAALAASERASMILGHLPAAALGGVTANLTAALARSEETVVGGVLKAVGHLGLGEAAPTVAAIFADSARSEAIRVAAADALGGIFAKMTAKPSEEVLKPVMDAAASESNAAVRLAAGRALGCAAFLGAADRATLLRGATK
ncbi:MAG: HEAT repeat domain-containing protein [Planctomycetes bacterium]|nr:HEAT repeat domain-containing protein [Planctomycetota bacterium]